MSGQDWGPGKYRSIVNANREPEDSPKSRLRDLHREQFEAQQATDGGCPIRAERKARQKALRHAEPPPPEPDDSTSKGRFVLARREAEARRQREAEFMRERLDSEGN